MTGAGALVGMRGVRIAHLIESDGPGGAERAVALLATRYQEAGATSVVFVPADGEGWLEEQLEGTRVRVEHFPPLPRPVSPGFSRWLVERLRAHEIQVAHSHEYGMAFYGAWACWLAHVPHVITMHGSAYYAEEARRCIALRAAASLSGCTVAVSDELRRHLLRDLRLAPSRIRMISNGVPPMDDAEPTLRRELGLRDDDRLVVAVGSLCPVKGHPDLVEAVARASREIPGLHLAIAGRGDLRASLVSRARELGIEDRVHLLGLRDDIPSVLRSADVFALSSLSEGLPTAVLEAMFAGLPVVATRVGQVPHVLESGTCGVLVPPGEPEELAAGLSRVLSDPDLAAELSRRARERARRDYSVDAMASRYAEIFRRLLPRSETEWPARGAQGLGGAVVTRKSSIQTR